MPQTIVEGKGTTGNTDDRLKKEAAGRERKRKARQHRQNVSRYASNEHKRRTNIANATKAALLVTLAGKPNQIHIAEFMLAKYIVAQPVRDETEIQVARKLTTKRFLNTPKQFELQPAISAVLAELTVQIKANADASAKATSPTPERQLTTA